MTKVEHAYKSSQQKCLAIIWSVLLQRPYFKGTFTVWTEHNLLWWVLSLADAAKDLHGGDSVYLNLATTLYIPPLSCNIHLMPYLASHRWHPHYSTARPTPRPGGCKWQQEGQTDYHHLCARGRYMRVHALFYRCWQYKRHTTNFSIAHNLQTRSIILSRRHQTTW